jgi:hypothetical protein
LELKAEGYVCTTEQLFHILLGVAATKDSLESVCSDGDGVAQSTTIRNYLNEQLQVKDLSLIERAINATLTSEIPSSVFVCPREIAIDYHDQGYYGKTEQKEGLWSASRSQKRDDSCLSGGNLLHDFEWFSIHSCNQVCWSER